MKRLMIFVLVFQLGCTTNSQPPLENTKKLIKKGHGDLYENGALTVPYTKVKIIPPGPKTAELAYSLIGINAHDSFFMALDNALSTTKLVKAGTLKSWDSAKKIHKLTGEVVTKMDEGISDSTLYLIDSSVKLPKHAWEESLELTGEIKQEMLDIEKRLRRVSIEFGEGVRKELVSGSKQTFYDWNRYLRLLSSDIQTSSKNYDQNVTQASRNRFKRWWDGGRTTRKEIISSAQRMDHSFSEGGSEVIEGGASLGRKSEESLSSFGNSFDAGFSYAGDETSAALVKAARSFNGWTEKKAKSHFKKSGDYIKGYLSLPQKLKEIGKDQTKSFQHFSRAFKTSNKERQNLNKKMSVIWNNYSSTAGKDIASTFDQAKKEVTENSNSIGYSLGVIKALSWMTKLVIWDLIVKPIGNVSLQAIGYLTINGILFPSMLIIREGLATSIVATKLTLNISEGIYEIVSPTVKAAIASTFAALEYTGGKAISVALLAPSTPIEYGLKLSGKVGELTSKGIGKVSNAFLSGSSLISGVAIKGTGKILRAPSYLVAPVADGVVKTGAVVQSVANETQAKLLHGLGYTSSHILRWPGHGVASIVSGTGIATGYAIEMGSKFGGHTAAAGVRYIGIPTMSLAVPTSFTAVGVATGATGSAIGAAGYSAGKVASGSTLVFGNTIAGTTAVVGTTASVAAGVAVSVYEFGKAVTVPSAYTLGSGIVMSYGMLTHLGAQSLLAVSDAAYLVLSLEGPRWVIYAVTGKLGKGKDLKPGTILDLEKMQNNGEQFKVVPTSSDQIKNILEGVETH